MIQKEAILQAYQFRHACKVFDENQKISDEDMQFLLETARLSPSSFGMEHWRFIVITDEKLKAKIRPHAYGQKQITTASHLVAVVAKTAAVQDETYIKKMFARHGQDKEYTGNMINNYKAALKEKLMQFINRYFYKKLTQKHAIFEWCARQCYIAAANMATSAAMIGIDSCFLEGFNKEKVEKDLELDTQKEELALLLALGYRTKEQPKKWRLNSDEIIEYRN